MVAPLNLLKSMCDNGFENRESVAHAAHRPRQVDDQGPPRHATDATRQDGRRNPGIQTGRPNGLSDTGNQSVHHRLGSLGSAIAGSQAGAASGHHQHCTAGDGRPEGSLDIGAIGDHDRIADHKAPPTERLHDDRPRTIGIDPARCAGGAGDDHCRAQVAHDSTQSPDLPPDFAVTRTSVIRACLSTALTMSISANAPTATAVSASISTPVRSAVRTVALKSTPSSTTIRSTSTPCTPIT